MNLKFFIVIIFVLYSSANLLAQRLPGNVPADDNTPTRPEKKGKFFAALVLKGPNLFDKWGLELGARVGTLINGNFGIGFGFYSLLTKNFIIPNQVSQPTLSLGYGGVEPEFAINIGDNVRIGWMCLIGVGYASDNSYSNLTVDYVGTGDWIFLLEPSQFIDFKFAKGFWACLSVNYRQSLGVNYLGLADKDLSGLVLTFSLKSLSY